MSKFVYIIVEGVQDVAFLGKVLALRFRGIRQKTQEELEPLHAQWLTSLLKWPRKNSKGLTAIDRLAVPAPVFYRTSADTVVAIRNAEGLSGLSSMLAVDAAWFVQERTMPDAVGVIVDSNGASIEKRHEQIAAALNLAELPVPKALGEVMNATPRVGIFALPAPGVPGCLEDVLLALADASYPELSAAARGYIQACSQVATRDTATTDWTEFREPAGVKKATIGAMAAALRPGKSTQVSIEDNRWLCDTSATIPELQPCLEFLNALIGSEPRLAP